MIGLFKIIGSNLLASFHNEPGGFSGRKLSAFFAVMMAAYNLRFASTEIAVEMTMTWLGFALLCLGIITMQQITEFKTGKNAPPTNTPAP